MTQKEIKAEIRELRKEMKELGIRRTSCFNGGLSRSEYLYNSQLFQLNVKLENAEKGQI